MFVWIHTDLYSNCTQLCGIFSDLSNSTQCVYGLVAICTLQGSTGKQIMCVYGYIILFVCMFTAVV